VSGTKRSAWEEWRENWALVLAAFVGISFAAVPLQSMAFFIDPISSEFGWSRTQVSIGASVFGLSVIPFAPFAGAIQDVLGPRRMAIVGVLACIVSLVSLGLTTGSVNLWIGQWAFYALAELPLKATVWLAIVTSVFVVARGLATAVVLCGTAAAQTIVPLVSYALIEAEGWRAAYVTLGMGWGGATLLLILLFFKEPRDTPRADGRAAGEYAAERQRLAGLTIREALRCTTLYRISVALMISAGVSLAVITHKVSILNEMGISRSSAALIAATAGIAAITGKLTTGWLYDRSDSTWIGVATFACSALGFILLLEPVRTTELIIVAMILFGLSAGGTLQAGMYLTAQYCGQRNFGKIFGAKSSFVALGIGSGPLLSGLIYDNFGSYEPLFILAVPLSVICCLLMFRLGPYPNWEEAERQGAGRPARGAAKPVSEGA
jgi:MFS family permease